MKNINISQIDSFFLNGGYPIEFLLYYKGELPTKKISVAMKQLSGLFWPLFGYYESGKIHGKKYIGSEFFTEERKNDDFGITQPYEKISEDLCIRSTQKSSTLFDIRIIHYNNGSVLIPRMDHLVGDGYSYFYFLSLLAALTQKNHIPLKNLLIRYKFKPHHSRNMLKPFHFSGEAAAPPEFLNKPVFNFEYITKKFIQDRIKYISRELSTSVSQNDILTSLVLKKTAEISVGNIKNDIELSIPIDIRQIIPQYGRRFFGNGLLFQKIRFHVSDIKNTDADELAVRIRQNMPNISQDIYISFLEQIEDHISKREINFLRPYDPEKGCLVTNLSRLPTHKLDFGAGKPDLVLPLTIGKNSAAIMADREHFILRYVH